MGDDIFIVVDTLKHPEIADARSENFYPSGRFYAGAPLIISPGIRLGVLSSEENTRLKDLAEVVVSLLRLQQARVAEEAATLSLRESEARFRHLADNAPVMVWVTEPDGHCSYRSKSWFAFTGQSAAGLGMTWLDVEGKIFVVLRVRQKFNHKTSIRHSLLLLAASNSGDA